MICQHWEYSPDYQECHAPATVRVKYPAEEHNMKVTSPAITRTLCAEHAEKETEWCASLEVTATEEAI